MARIAIGSNYVIDSRQTVVVTLAMSSACVVTWLGLKSVVVVF